MLPLQGEEIKAALVAQRDEDQALVERAVALCARKLMKRAHLLQEVAQLGASGDDARVLWQHDFRADQTHLARATHCALELTPLGEMAARLNKTLLYDADITLLDNLRQALGEEYEVGAYSQEAAVRVWVGPAAGGFNACVIS